MLRYLSYLPLLLVVVSCTTFQSREDETTYFANIPPVEGTLQALYAPSYLVENPHRLYNRIGTPVVIAEQNDQAVVIDPHRPAIYYETRTFTTARDNYTNLIYRVHFLETPDNVIPFRLEAGKNVGNLLVVTLNSARQPVLYTTVQTCGCYLAFVPTSYLAKECFPVGWPENTQRVYGEKLPAFLSLEGFDPHREQVMIFLRDATHRTVDLFRVPRDGYDRFESVPTGLFPVGSLETLPIEGGGTTSFFEQNGPQQGFVRNNSKIWERILMSWWTFDWRIGEDKKLGKNKSDPPVFFTSLKPWARSESDMRDFNTFLSYWGWNL